MSDPRECPVRRARPCTVAEPSRMVRAPARRVTSTCREPASPVRAAARLSLQRSARDMRTNGSQWSGIRA